jgi:mannose-6-phosphate isomerase-like protein (cupin superfamily)
MSVSPIDLSTAALHLRRDGGVRVEERTFDPQRDGWQLMTFHVESDADVHADHWEMHPGADEVVTCLTGGIRLYLRPERPGDREDEVTLEAGSAVVVPRGRWHRIELDRASDIMAITLASGTRIEKRT